MTALVVAACGTAAPSATQRPRFDPPAPARTSNQRRAQLDAAALLAKLNLPAGTTRSRSEPKGDDRLLRARGELIADQAHVVRYAWWTLNQSPDAVVAYVKAHPPAGSRLVETGSTTDGARSLSVSYAWPAIAGVLGERELAITVASLGDGRTGVLAQAQSDWIVPRSPQERIPPGVREVDVTSTRVNGSRTVSLQVTNGHKVHTLIKLLNSMAIVQPVAIACPALIAADAREITLSFRAARRGPVLATASFRALGPNLESASTECNPVELTIRGRRQTPLIGGDFVRHAERLLGVSLTRP